MTFNVRRLVKNGKNEINTAAGGVLNTRTGELASGKSEPATGVVVGRSADVNTLHEHNKAVAVEQARAEVKIREDLAVETADNHSGGLGGGNQIRNKNMYGSILDEYIHTDIDATDAVQMGRTKDVSVNRLYRDMFYHDPICGGAVDLMSTMPFSDFSLQGAKDPKVYQKFEDSIHNMNIKPLLPQLSAEYMVHGLFVATTMFDQNEGTFDGIVPQQIDYVEITPVPIFGRDPLITLMVGEAYKDLVKTDDPRMKEYESLIKPAQETLKPDPQDVLYIPRRALMRDFRGVSIYRRLLTNWLLERALYRGTIDQSMKRQRSVTHLICGDQDWTPTQAEMQQMADMLAAADLDPVGALFVTRTGVQVNDIRNANDLWKVTDLADFFTQNKLRSLGISESFLSGDASYNSLEQAMSVFVEQMRSYRDMLSYELFYDRTFPRIANANEFMKRRYALETADGMQIVEEIQRGNIDQLSLFSKGGLGGAFFDRADGESITKLSREEKAALFIPTVHWFKRLRPEADQEYIGMLQQLQENGLPIPLRMWAAAGGIDLDSLLNQKKDDLELRKSLKDWTKVIHPPEEGGDMPGAPGGGGDGLDLSHVTAPRRASTLRPKNIIDRFKDVDPEQYGARNMAGGKRHIMSAKGQKIMEEKVNKQIATAAAEVNRRQNAMEKRLDDFFASINSGKKIYT
ncbi:hypothetical protein EVB87_263 [Rhizobium phage RHph_N28_1]|nr:hypothetical protein EVB87_263 [Rhizobium phage RHph_N28_1]QIG74292.1 hypothetical protein EVC07_264 [Rhizobium phage RHph_N42]QXV73951.1 hypothetical protein [Rhizobium phage RHph_N46]